MTNRLRVAVLALALAPLGASAQAPTVRPGECLYLIGAPPGAPAAATEQAYDGTKVYDVCTHVPHVEVGRDAPHRLTAWMEWLTPSTSDPAGCTALAWSSQEFVIPSDVPSVVSVGASGDLRGYYRTNRADLSTSPTFVSLTIDLLEVGTDGSERAMVSRSIFRTELNSNELVLDEAWAATLQAHAARGGQYRVRLTLMLEAGRFFRDLDFGTPGSSRGAAIASVEACVIPTGGDQRQVGDEIERDLYEKRCMPSVWLPAALGGRLEEAVALVDARTTSAETSGAPSVNLHVARQRLERARTQQASGDYQQACRSLSDAIHALTTP